MIEHPLSALVVKSPKGLCLFQASVGDFRADGTHSSRNEVAEPALFFLLKNPVGDSGEGSGRTSVAEGRLSDLRLRGVARRVVRRLQVSGKFSDNSRRLGSCTDEYQHLKLNASHSGVEVNDDALFLQAARGVNNKGLVYGLGNQTQAYYESGTVYSILTLHTHNLRPLHVRPDCESLAKIRRATKCHKRRAYSKEEVKQTKDAIARIESRFGSTSS
ncbi:hypothetical protein Cgig2_022100 [Carnegiea gigantea]|uniref:Uncharacterized protein n=1 Tax=Carnegiea gigantea TaxID=171969 RepID=A0A9Q1JK96_9CARY|nr:hypothetical protein Cgig2_022100 [Carnegiea gigantea]